MLNPGFWKSYKILNSGFGKAKILELAKILYSGFWKAKILKASKTLNSGFEKLKSSSDPKS